MEGVGDATGSVIETAPSLHEAYRIFVHRYMSGAVYILPPPYIPD